MERSELNTGLPKPLQAYIPSVCAIGMAWMVYLAIGADWSLSVLGELGLFVLLIVVAGSFPMPVSPRVKADVTTAVLFGAALLLEPGIAALAGVAGITTYTLLNRFWGDRPRLPWYKYPFNAGETALFMGISSLVFQTVSAGDGLLTPAVVPAAAAMYLVNTSLVSGAASLQMGINPVHIWWAGTRENGPSELAQLAFGFLGAVVYLESPWTIVALFIPVAIIYIAFSRLARANIQLGTALQKLEDLQERIVGTAKLASVGAISIDLAHQIKNPLAILLGRLEELQDRLAEGSKERRHLDIANEAGWRIQELTQTFATIGRQEWVQLDMAGLLDEAFGMTGLRNRKSIIIQREYFDGLFRVRGNPVLIREALSNIFSNSMDAVEKDGLITIGASRVNGHVIVSITDNGVGIPANRMAHMFEPFQTTKPNGHGLGLFAAKHILEMHQGTVEVENEEGTGTKVTVTLPAGHPPVESEAESSDNQLSVLSL